MKEHRRRIISNWRSLPAELNTRMFTLPDHRNQVYIRVELLRLQKPSRRRDLFAQTEIVGVGNLEPIEAA